MMVEIIIAMENQNIPYRRLRDTRRAKTGKTPASLLVPKGAQPTKQRSRSKNRQSSIMTQNVTRYEHMLRDPYTKQNYIDWIVKLREPIKTAQQTEKQVGYAVPNVFNKTTESRENFLKGRQASMKTFNSADFYEIISRKECARHVQMDNLGFMTGLRFHDSNTKGEDDKPRFCNVPYKDRHQFPTFLNKQSIKKLTNVQKQQKESGFDGSHNFPPYRSKIQGEKNYGVLCAFTRTGSQASMPVLSWQMGLRNCR